jgi:hypothetical protein
MSIKLLVNDKKIWDSFNELIDQKLKFVHSQLEQTMKSEDLYRLQGEARAFRRLKLLRDEVNGSKPD